MATANAYLADWPGVGNGSAVTLLLGALDHGNVIIEYYKYGASEILDLQRGWARQNE